MQKKSLLSNYLKYLIPTIATMTLFSTYTMVDGIFVGRGVGTEGLAAVNISMPFVNLAFAFAILISIGSLNLIAHEKGRGNKKGADEFFSLGLSIAVIFALSLSFLGFIFINPLIMFLGASGPMIELVKEYLSIIIIFLPFYLTSYVFEIMVKADGRPSLTTKLMLMSALTNIILDYIFIFKFHLGLRGAAIATGLAQTIPTIGYVIYFLSPKSYLKFKKFRLRSFMLKEIFSYGFPASLSELSSGFCILVFNLAIGKLYGEIGLAAFSVIAYVMSFVVNTMLAINQSSQPLLGYYYGAREYDKIPIIRKYMLRSVAVLSLIMVAAIELWPEFFINVFLTDQSSEFMNFASKSLRIFALSFLILGFNITNGGYLTAVGSPRYDFIITLLRGYVFVTIFSLIVTIMMAENAIWFVLLGSDFLTMLLSIFLIKKQDKKLKLMASKKLTNKNTEKMAAS